MKPAGLFAPLPPWPFHGLEPHWANLIVVDPPWRFENYSAAGEKKGPQAQYPETYPPEEIASLFPVGELADINCLALVWATWPLIQRQMAVLHTWKLELRSVLVWQKVSRHGRPMIGTGYRVRSMCEPVLVATRGNPRHEPFPGLFAGVRREHSRKPQVFFDLIDWKCPALTRRVELFARQRRPGWRSWGKEIDRFAEVPP